MYKNCFQTTDRVNVGSENFEALFGPFCCYYKKAVGLQLCAQTYHLQRLNANPGKNCDSCFCGSSNFFSFFLCQTDNHILIILKLYLPTRKLPMLNLCTFQLHLALEPILQRDIQPTHVQRYTGVQLCKWCRRSVRALS
jgi:hypothetical protein